MKKLKLTLLYLFGFAALLLVFTVVINLSIFDEELLPEVAAIKNIKAQPYGVDNAYPALIAINGSSGKTLKQASKEVRDFLNNKIATTGLDYLSDEEMNTLIGKDHDKSWQNIYDSCNSRTNKNCMAQLNASLKQQPISDVRLLQQLLRYEDFIQYNDFKEITQFDLNAPIGPYGSLIKIKRLFLANVYNNQTSQSFMDKAIQDMSFWRMVLRKGNLLITEMIAVATLSDDINSFSTAIQQGHFNSNQLSQLQDLITTLSKGETDLGRVLEFEYKCGINLVDDEYATNGMGNPVETWLFQPKATHNMNYINGTKPMKKLAALNAYDFNQYNITSKHTVDFKSPVSWSPTMLYNPTGKLSLDYSLPAYKTYIGRMHDLNGMFYLLKLQIEIALNADKAVEQVVAQSQFTNPYTLEPMNYNSETRSIYFECMDKTSSCELDL